MIVKAWPVCNVYMCLLLWKYSITECVDVFSLKSIHSTTIGVCSVLGFNTHNYNIFVDDRTRFPQNTSNLC